MSKSKKAAPPTDSKAPKPVRPLQKVVLRFLSYGLLLGALLYTINDHPNFDPVRRIGEAFTERRWSFYHDFAKKNPVSVLVMGNSLAIHGINPQNLSSALGCTAFTLAAPGTYYRDQYFALKEAIRVQKPELVVFETFGLKEGEDRGATFKSFTARKDVPVKVASTPFIFDVNDYAYAWANAVRNHSNLYARQPIPFGDSMKIQDIRQNNDLYLGRYICFTQGIDDNNFEKITKDSLYFDATIESSQAMKNYVQSVVELCKANNIQLMFLTIPLFRPGIQGVEQRDSVLEDLLQGQKWLNLQAPENYVGYDRACFQNCSGCVFHMTYHGSLVTTYKLVDYINSQSDLRLPDRKFDPVWRQVFYRKDGFYENNPPAPNDPAAQLIYQGEKKAFVSEIIQLAYSDAPRLMIKVRPNEQYNLATLRNKTLSVALEGRFNGAVQPFAVKAQLDPLHSHSENAIFLTVIDKRLTDLKFLGVEVL